MSTVNYDNMLIPNKDDFDMVSVSDVAGVIINYKGSLIYNDGSSLSGVVLAIFCDGVIDDNQEAYGIHYYGDEFHLVNYDSKTITIFKDISVDHMSKSTHNDIKRAILEAKVISFDEIVNRAKEDK